MNMDSLRPPLPRPPPKGVKDPYKNLTKRIKKNIIRGKKSHEYGFLKTPPPKAA